MFNGNLVFLVIPSKTSGNDLKNQMTIFLIKKEEENSADKWLTSKRICISCDFGHLIFEVIPLNTTYLWCNLIVCKIINTWHCFFKNFQWPNTPWNDFSLLYWHKIQIINYKMFSWCMELPQKPNDQNHMKYNFPLK